MLMQIQQTYPCLLLTSQKQGIVHLIRSRQQNNRTLCACDTNSHMSVLCSHHRIPTETSHVTRSYSQAFADLEKSLPHATPGKRYPYTSGIARCDSVRADAQAHALRHKQDTPAFSLQAGG